jgi:PAS domain S-box-containing protein
MTRRTSRVRVLLTLAAAILVGSCGPREPQRVRVSLPNDGVMGHRDQQGRPGGFVVDALNEAAARAGVRLEWIVIGGLQENDAALSSGRIDLTVGVDTPERRRSFVVSDSWWSSEFTILAPAASSIRADADLRGTRLAVPQGAGDELPRRFQPGEILGVPSAPAVAQAVCSGTAEAGVIASMYLRELLYSPSAACAGFKLRAIDSAVRIDYVLVARPAAARVVGSIRGALDEVTADGTLARIAARHPPISTPHATRLADLVRARAERRLWFVAAVGAAVMIGLAVLFLVGLGRARKRLADANTRLRRDVGARAQAEIALRESEDRFRTLIDSAPDAIFAQTDGRFVFVNPAMLKLVGASTADQLLGHECFERIAPEFHEAVTDRIRSQQATGGIAAPMEQEYVRLDQARVPVETVAVAFRFQERDAHLVFVRDVTSRRKAEADRVALHAELLQAQKMESLGRLAGGIAHDFNNILTVQKSYCHVLQQGPPSDGELREGIAEIDACADRAAALTRQLLAFSRRQAMQPQVLDLNALVANLAGMLRRVIGEDVTLACIRAPGPARVKADPGQVEQVLLNLAVNARDAMPHGGHLTIEVGLVDLDESHTGHLPELAPGPHVVLALTDSGSGMDEETRRRMFEPFFTTKGAGKGTGLGLSTVYGIVRQSGGAISVDSAPGLGTTFRIFLPRTEADVPQTPGTESEPRRGGGESVLVVEDEASLRRVVALALGHQGYRVTAAANADEALVMVEEQGLKPELVLTDVVMPGTSGPALVERLKTILPGLKVLYMSGYTDDATVRHGVWEGQIAFLQKPFSASQLAAALAKVLSPE